MRRKYIDWLRIFGIILLFPYHTFRVFDPGEANYVENAAKSAFGQTFMAAVWPWFMPLLFLVAGISTWYALQKRDGRHFTRERVMRLLVPLVLGILFIVPIQGYVARLQEGTLQGGYLNYLFTQFLPDFSDISGYHGTFTPAHLWFILYLFVISMVLLPIFLLVVRKRAKQGIGGFGRLFEKGWFLFLLFIPLTISEGLPDLGGKNPFFFGLYYVIGFFIASSDGAWKTIDRIRWPALAVLAVTIPGYFLLRNIAAGKDDFAWQSIIWALVRNLYGITALLCMLAFAGRYLNRGGKALDYMNQAAFPVYILHQSVMMAVAYFVVQWNIGTAPKMIAIMAVTLALCVALFEVCRHVPPLRVLLGIKKVKKPTVRQAEISAMN